LISHITSLNFRPRIFNPSLHPQFHLFRPYNIRSLETVLTTVTSVAAPVLYTVTIQASRKHPAAYNISSCRC
jgi:predicted homoserine dehydrogenase-like protein